jgi:hypothetical protein
METLFWGMSMLSALTVILLLVVIVGALEQIIQLLSYDDDEEGGGLGYPYTLDPDNTPDPETRVAPDLDDLAREFYRLIHTSK